LFSVVNLLKCYSSRLVFNLQLRHDILQGSVATDLRFGDDIIANFLFILTVKQIRKSVNIW